MCQNLDLWFLFYCLLMLVFFSPFVAYYLFPPFSVCFFIVLPFFPSFFVYTFWLLWVYL
jgi:hypothetical protein